MTPRPYAALITRYPAHPAATGPANTSYINALNAWGMSYMDTTGGPLFSGFQVANKLFSALGISWPRGRNFGQGGTQVTSDWRYMMRTARPVRDNWGDTTWQAKFSPQVFLYGANDVGVNGDPTFESSRFLNDWSNTWRAVFSYFRAGAVHTPDYIYGATTADHVPWDTLFPGGKAGVTYTGTWASTTSTDYVCLGADARQTTATTGATIAVRLPPNFPGTPVTLYFGGEQGATGSTNATVTHGGTSPASPIALVTNNRVRSPSTYYHTTAPVGPAATVPTIVPVRILGIPAGNKSTSQTITVNAGTLTSGHKLTFLGWTIEAIHPPLLVPANVPPAGTWEVGPGYNTNALAGNSNGAVLQWAAYPQSNGIQTGTMPQGPRSGPQAADTWCRSSYNPALATVASEFAPAGTVAVADLARVIDGTVNPELYGPGDLAPIDNLHPNTLGRAVIVKEFLDAMNRVALDPRHLIAPVDANDMAEGAAMLAEADA